MNNTFIGAQGKAYSDHPWIELGEHGVGGELWHMSEGEVEYPPGDTVVGVSLRRW